MKNINHLPPEDRQNFMLCPHCSEYVDLHNLSNAVNHIKGKCLHRAKRAPALPLDLVHCVEILGDKFKIDLN